MTEKLAMELKESAGYDRKDRLRGYLYKVDCNRTGLGSVPVYFWSKKNAEKFAEQDYTGAVQIAKFDMNDEGAGYNYVTTPISDLDDRELIALV